MKNSSLILTSLSLLGFSPARGTDATAPLDFALRNQPFAPSATISPVKQEPSRDDTVQNKRVEKTTVDKQLAAIGERRAAVDVQETHEKNLREVNSHRPDAAGQPMSTFNHRAAPMATASDSHQPPLVAKYQDSLSAASAANMAHFPAQAEATNAKINRFVFRRNSPESGAVIGNAPVTPAGGTSSSPK